MPIRCKPLHTECDGTADRETDLEIGVDIGKAKGGLRLPLQLNGHIESHRARMHPSLNGCHLYSSATAF